MKRSNLEVGMRVILKKDTLGLGISWFIGQEFTVSRVESAGCAGDLIVEIDGPRLAWCSHRDLKRVKEEAPKPAERPFKAGDKRQLGQKFRVTANEDKYHRFSTGDAVTLCIVRDTEGGHKYRRGSDGLEQWLLDAQAEPMAEADHAKAEDKAPEIGALFVVTGRTTPGHCFDVGTVVRCAEVPRPDGGNCRYEDTDGTRQFVSPSDLKPLSLADIQAALDK